MLGHPVVSDSWDPMDCSPPGSSVHGDSPCKNTGVGCHAFLQGIFPTQGSNPGLLYCKWVLYQLSHQGSCDFYFYFFKLGVATVFETCDANSLSKTGICLVPDLTFNLNCFPGVNMFFSFMHTRTWSPCVFNLCRVYYETCWAAWSWNQDCWEK